MSQDIPLEEVTAALIAIDMLLAEEAREAPTDPSDRRGWRDAARLAAVHLAPVRTPVRPAWHTVERLRGSGG